VRTVCLEVVIAVLGVAVLATVFYCFYCAGRRIGGRGRADEEPGIPGASFDVKSLDFARGVEFGLLFASVKDCGRAEMAVHADMAELVMRLAESRDLPFSGKPHQHDEHCAECIGRSDCKDGGEWLDVRIG
jgi:hypothetical protein